MALHKGLHVKARVSASYHWQAELELSKAAISARKGFTDPIGVGVCFALPCAVAHDLLCRYRAQEALEYLVTKPWQSWHNLVMPILVTPKAGMPPGTLPMLILHVLQSGSLHGYAIAQRIHVLSSEVLTVEEGLLYPTLQKMLLKGWVTSKWGTSETNRKVRFYQLSKAGREQLKSEVSGFDRATQAILDVLRTA